MTVEHHAGCEIAEKLSGTCTCGAVPPATEVLAEAMWVGETGAKWEFAQTNYAEAYRAKAADTLFALSAAGYAVVPVDPTDEMTEAGAEVILPEDWPDARAVWAAMVAAAFDEDPGT